MLIPHGNGRRGSSTAAGRIGGSSRGKWLSCQSSVINTFVAGTAGTSLASTVARAQLHAAFPMWMEPEGSDATERPARNTKRQGFLLSASTSFVRAAGQEGMDAHRCLAAGLATVCNRCNFPCTPLATGQRLETAGGVLKPGLSQS